MKIPFVKGHMGGNTIALFREDSFSRSDLPASVVRALADENLACHEAGLITPLSPERLALKIVGRSSRNWITACGGLTQVLGTALTKDEACRQMKLERRDPPFSLLLDTDAGPTPLTISGSDEAPKIWTDMTAFLHEIVHDGMEEMELAGFPAFRIGKFLVLDVRALEKRHDLEAIENLSPDSRQTLLEIQRSFLKRPGKTGFDFALFDDRPSRGGDFRVLFPHNLAEGHIEPTCGTGTVAVGVALFAFGVLAEKAPLSGDGFREIVFEAGGGAFLGGPERSRLRLEVREQNLSKAFFSHDAVRITAIGELLLSGGENGIRLRKERNRHG